jgi:ferredoxin
LIYTDGLQINLTHCQECPNGHILAGVHFAHERSLEVIPSHNLNLVCVRSELGYQPPLFSRRNLFLFLRERSSRAMVIMLERLQRETQGESYGSKQVPLLRAMLIKSMEPLLEVQRRKIAEHLFGQVSFTSTCTACGGCSSVCPTGAIQPIEEDMQTPIFEHELCVSCGSCQAFCRKKGVVLTTTPVNDSSSCSKCRY